MLPSLLDRSRRPDRSAPGLPGPARAARALAIGLGAAIVAAALSAAVPAVAATTLQAESATLSGGAVVQTDHSGYTGSGFVGGFTDAAKGSASVAFAVSRSAAGNADLALRYANGTGTAMTLSLVVDGSARQVSLPATSSWDSWTTVTTSVALAAGSHSVAYAFRSSDSGNVNLDALTVADGTSAGGGGGTGGGTGGSTGTLQAEQASLSGGAVMQTEHSGYTGSGYVGGFTDANKGSAAVTFAVSRAAAGDADLGLRYANGTGVPMTLSLVVDGGAARQLSLPATASWDAWSTVTSTVTLAAGSHSVQYRFGSGDSGNVNLDALAVADSSSGGTGGGGTGGGTAGDPTDLTQSENAFLAGGAGVYTALSGYTGSGYVTGFDHSGARLVQNVRVATSGARTASIRFQNYSGASRSLALQLNGRSLGDLTLPAGSGWQTATKSLPFAAGINALQLAAAGSVGDVAIDRITVDGSSALATRGASLPYTEYEAESGSTDGTVIGPDRTYRTVASESSGRKAVQLTQTGQKVSVTLTAAANALTIRASIPDTADGAGQQQTLGLYANGAKLTDVTLSSVYSWVYGEYPFDHYPSDGKAHHFYEETRVRVGDLAPGTVVTLQKDASSTAASYTIDLIDAEQLAPALTAPSNALSITDYGARADGSDSTAAIASAVRDGASQHRPVWIPQGTFRISSRIDVQGVTILGAGTWYSAIQQTRQGRAGKGVLFGVGGGVVLSDFAIFGESVVRDDGGADAAIEGDFGTGSLFQRLYIARTKVGFWISDGTNGLDIVGVRIRDTFADGVNVYSGLSGSATTGVTVEQSSIRNTGDDALAMFSDRSAVSNSTFRFDTVQLPALANGAAIYGGSGNAVTDLLVSDTVTAATGITVGTRFTNVGLTGPTTVARSTLTRTGSTEPNLGYDIGALWIFSDNQEISTPIAVSDLTITDSTKAAVLISYAHPVTGLTFDRLRIDGTGTSAFELNTTGSATVTNTSVAGTRTGAITKTQNFDLRLGAGNSGF